MLKLGLRSADTNHMDTSQNTPLLTARVVVCDPAGNILLMRRSYRTVLPGLWELPGGKLDPGETSEQAAVRETWEEAGLTIELARLLDTDYDVWAGAPIHTDVWIARPLDSALVPVLRPREHMDWAWFAPDQLPSADALTSTTSFALGHDQVQAA